jgi:methyl-accepting chemotaxis protein
MHTSSLSRAAGAAMLSLSCVALALAAPYLAPGLMAPALGLALAGLAYGLLQLGAARREIRKVTAACRGLIAGDFEQRILYIDDRGELGEMQLAVNDMIDRLDAFIREARASTVAIAENRYYRRIQLEGLQGSLKANAELVNEATTIIRERVGAFETETSGFKKVIDEVVSTLMSASNTMSTASGRLETDARSSAERTAAVASSASVSSRDLQSISSAISELAASAGQLTENFAHSADIAAGSVAKARESRRAINELGEAASKIGEIIALIESIADQTNLLALNATIEAARAGEAGRGFAVVAGEVKALAQQSARATGEITQQISSIRNALNLSVAAIEGVGDAILQLDEITRAAAVTIEQQGHATQEIAQSVASASTGTSRVSDTIADITEIAQSNRQMAVEVKEAAGGVTAQAKHLSQAVDDFMLSLRQGPLDRRRTLKKDYAGPERRNGTPG